MKEPSENCVGLDIYRWHGGWRGTAKWRVGPFSHKREADGNTYEEVYNAIALNHPEDTIPSTIYTVRSWRE